MRDALYATINPKILGKEFNYIYSATIANFDVVIKEFSRISKGISPLLADFSQYRITRVDYCINFFIDELIPGCNPQLIMDLIKRSDVPDSYTMGMEYDHVSHRMKGYKSSFYLINGSVNINCYKKRDELEERNTRNLENHYPLIPQDILDSAESVIRFEVQCKPRKIHELSKLAEEDGNKDTNKYKYLLSREMCSEIITNYFLRFLGPGDWYTLAYAEKVLRSKEFNAQKETGLIDALRLVSQRRGIYNAKQQLSKEERTKFGRRLLELNKLGINPVTIPREWGISRIPNLLRAYNRLYDEESEMIKQWNDPTR